MKWKLHSAALVAAINLALTSSVLAMPTGGVVASGSVTGIDNGTVASGGTIATAGGPAVINWGAFSLLKGESLTVNTVNGALLNRVTGTQLSELRGFLRCGVSEESHGRYRHGSDAGRLWCHDR